MKHFFLLTLLLSSLTIEARETWLFLGDSITQQGDYVDYIETWYTLNEQNVPEMINLGLSGETISGLSEPIHDFPRACLIDRIDQVLKRVKPDRVIACYGMNCAIYHPFSDERFNAYKNGIQTLIKKSHEIDADIILLTPPPYAGRIYPSNLPEEGVIYGYQNQYPQYNDVLKKYAEWILSLDVIENVQAFNIRSGIDKFMEKCYPHEPVHPNFYGHELMAEIGHTNPGMLKRFNGSIAVSEKKVNFINDCLETISRVSKKN